jgi:2-haloacid dehalogenase
MATSRRSFLQVAAGSALAGVAPWPRAGADAPRHPVRAIAFDAFPIFDPRPIAALAEALLPGHGGTLMGAWRARQFEYQWQRALAGRYVDFLQVTGDSLDFALELHKLRLSPRQRERLMSAWTSLPVWPDVPDAVAALRQAGLRLAFLSNMTEAMLTDGLARAGLAKQFDAVISTDRIRTYKPAAAAYRLGVETLRLPAEAIVFVAFAGWDVAGAKWFGYPTFWLNRQGAAPERLGVEADASGPDLPALVRYLT